MQDDASQSNDHGPRLPPRGQRICIPAIFIIAFTSSMLLLTCGYEPMMVDGGTSVGSARRTRGREKTVPSNDKLIMVDSLMPLMEARRLCVCATLRH